MDEPVLVERRGAVQVITINRPAERNAISLAVDAGVTAAVEELEADDDLRAGVLTGAGGTFSSGMDLKGFLRGELPGMRPSGMCGITKLRPRKPLIAAVEGHAVAGGFEVALACDLIVAGETATFGVAEVKRGLVAAGGGAVLLAKRIPVNVAMEMLLTGATIAAARAAEIGLVNRVVPAGEALDAACALAEQIAQNGPLAVAASKAILQASLDWTFDEAWEGQNAFIGPVFSSEDAREGAAAFAEKRPPVWKGR